VLCTKRAGFRLKITALTRYDRRGASSRLRFLQYFPELQRHGFVLQHEFLFPDVYVESLQFEGASRAVASRALLKRAFSLRKARHCDAIWIEKDALPWLPAFLECKLLPQDVPLAVDYDDAVFHQYEDHSSSFIRFFLKSKHQALIRRADLVIAGNQYIADYAWRVGARRVEVLPTVVDLERYQLSSGQSSLSGSTPPIVGWIGQRSTASFLRTLAPVFEHLGKSGSMSFRAIGVDAASLYLPMSSEEWSESTEVASIQKLDIGIMPLDESPFARGKCGYKLIQYMACGLPVVASPVGVNNTLVEHGVNGFLANSLAEWGWALQALAKDPALRYRMGQAGRAKVEREYCLKTSAPLLTGWLTEVAQRSRI